MSRVATAIVLGVLALYAIFFGPLWFYIIVVTAMAGLCYHEFVGMARAQGVEGPLWFGYGAGAVILFNPDPVRLLVVTLLGLCLGFGDLRKVLPFAGAVLLGVAYIFGAWRCAIDLRLVSPWWILYALAINWSGDIAAYYVGRAIGKRKLAPNISPGKSWEGAFGSIAASAAFGLWFGHQTGLRISDLQMVTLSVIANIAGQVGDLAESAMKRGAGLKDSGSLLPGHGGFLDRLDSSLFTMPVVYYFVRYLKLM